MFEMVTDNMVQIVWKIDELQSNIEQSKPMAISEDPQYNIPALMI